MMRLTATKAIVTPDEADALILVQQLEAGKIEMANQEGNLCVWSHDEDGKDVILEIEKKGNAYVAYNFPTRYIDTGKEIIEVTRDNLKDYNVSEMLKEIPEKYLEVSPAPLDNNSIPIFDDLTWEQVKQWIRDNGLTGEYDLRSESKTRELLAINYEQ